MNPQTRKFDPVKRPNEQEERDKLSNHQRQVENLLNHPASSKSQPLEQQNNKLRKFLKTYNDLLTRLIKSSATKELFGIDQHQVEFSQRPTEFQLKTLEKEISNVDQIISIKTRELQTKKQKKEKYENVDYLRNLENIKSEFEENIQLTKKQTIDKQEKVRRQGLKLDKFEKNGKSDTQQKIIEMTRQTEYQMKKNRKLKKKMMSITDNIVKIKQQNAIIESKLDKLKQKSLSIGVLFEDPSANKIEYEQLKKLILREKRKLELKQKFLKNYREQEEKIIKTMIEQNEVISMSVIECVQEIEEYQTIVHELLDEKRSKLNRNEINRLSYSRSRQSESRQQKKIHSLNSSQQHLNQNVQSVSHKEFFTQLRKTEQDVSQTFPSPRKRSDESRNARKQKAKTEKQRNTHIYDPMPEPHQLEYQLLEQAESLKRKKTIEEEKTSVGSISKDYELKSLQKERDLKKLAQEDEDIYQEFVQFKEESSRKEKSEGSYSLRLDGDQQLQEEPLHPQSTFDDDQILKKDISSKNISRDRDPGLLEHSLSKKEKYPLLDVEKFSDSDEDPFQMPHTPKDVTGPKLESKRHTEREEVKEEEGKEDDEQGKDLSLNVVVNPEEQEKEQTDIGQLDQPTQLTQQEDQQEDQQVKQEDQLVKNIEADEQGAFGLDQQLQDEYQEKPIEDQKKKSTEIEQKEFIQPNDDQENHKQKEEVELKQDIVNLDDLDGLDDFTMKEDGEEEEELEETVLNNISKENIKTEEGIDLKKDEWINPDLGEKQPEVKE